ncbi:acyltransferase [Sporolactobacillus sp. STSJ-5]|uniref:acyltransferase n=1 Tax=Sporolactobacillus sp. STSJ-5 TaxID=2965076 RepID=UPI00272A9A16|nr:acyltransferase [Sporolactobacillus sp. STSJ-5]
MKNVDWMIWKLNRFMCLVRGNVLPFNKKNRRILIEKYCTFKNYHWITLDGNNEIQKGTFISADNPFSVNIGNGTTISRFSIIQSMQGVINIGSNSQIGDFCNLYGQGNLNIGKDVMIASNVQIVPNQHTYEDISKPIKENPEISKGINIQDDVWIGTNVSILDGVTIGKGSIIGAGSIVNRDVPPYCVYAGVPARLIKKRRPK